MAKRYEVLSERPPGSAGLAPVDYGTVHGYLLMEFDDRQAAIDCCNSNTQPPLPLGRVWVVDRDSYQHKKGVKTIKVVYERPPKP